MTALWSFVEKISSAADFVAQELIRAPEADEEANSSENYQEKSETIDTSFLMDNDCTLAFPAVGKHVEESFDISNFRDDISTLKTHTSSVARSAEAAGGFFKNIVSTLKPHISGVPSLLYSTFFPDSSFLHKITDNLYIMDFPESPIIEELSHTLDTSHPSHYMILNMSERQYDTEAYFLLGQCIEIHYKGLPAPPVLVQLLLCMQVYNWLAANSKNILVVHCFHGYGRSAVFLACFMTWRGLFDHPLKALHTICQRLDLSDDFLGHILPSQRRYLGYFDVIMNGYSPHTLPLLLKTIAFHGLPVALPDDASISMAWLETCLPVLEVWQEGQILYSSETNSTVTVEKTQIQEETPSGVTTEANTATVVTPSFSVQDLVLSFPIDVEIYGDVLVRLKLSEASQRLHSVMRAAFHTGFITEDFIRFKKHELDGIAVDSRFPAACYLELHFESLKIENAEELEEQTKIIAQARRGAREARDALRRHEGWIEERARNNTEEGSEMQPMVYLLAGSTPDGELSSKSQTEVVWKGREGLLYTEKSIFSEKGLVTPDTSETPSLMSALNTASIPTLVRPLTEEEKVESDKSEDEGWGDDALSGPVPPLLTALNPVTEEIKECDDQENEEEEEEDEFAIAWDINEAPPLQPWKSDETEKQDVES